MDVFGKLETEVELKSSAQKFYNLISSQAHHIPTTSDCVHSVELLEGHWDSTGSIHLWKYNFDGIIKEFKNKVDLDEENKLVIFTAIGGSILEKYKSFRINLHAIPNGNGADLVKITIEYEKFKADDPPPNHFVPFIVKLVRDMDAHLLKA